MKNRLYKRVTAFAFTAVLVCTVVFPPARVYSGQIAQQGENSNLVHSIAALPFNQEAVMLKYMARENHCTLISDEQNKTVSIVDQEGFTRKTYTNVFYIEGEPIQAAALLEFDLGWTLCRHVQGDWFDNKKDAITAGGLAYRKQSEDGKLTFYVGQCILGYYFSGEADLHKTSCQYHVFEDMHQETPIVIENGWWYAEELTENTEMQNEQSDAPVIPDVENIPIDILFDALFYENLRPVMLKYIARKNNSILAYNKQDETLFIFDQEGVLETRYKYVPSLYNEFTADVKTLERDLTWESFSHDPDTDLFDSEFDAVIAGWLTYFHPSKDATFTFYTGRCFMGHYFSLEQGSHGSGCRHSILEGMHEDTPVIIENGRLRYGDAISQKEHIRQFYAYATNKEIKGDKPEESLTKMVTVFHTQYDSNDGVQSAYYSIRDRVYRDYWQDLANYDATDYIFIPPAFVSKFEDTDITPEGIVQYYKAQNEINATALAGAVESLLKHKKDAGIWVGTPGITSENFSHEAITAEAVTDFLQKVRRKLTSNVWHQNVKGVYINQESLYGEDTRQQTDRIKQVVADFKAKNESKEALWIPYYDMAADSTVIAQKIAEISQIPDLFDYIVIQPGYFFLGEPPDATAHRRQNLQAIQLSAQNNYVSDSTGDAVKGESSYAQIGFEMEFQNSYFSNSRNTRPESINRYTYYLMTGAKVKDANPVVFYASGDPHCNLWLVYKFYDADTLQFEAVRKRLDNRIDSFFQYVFANRKKEAFYLNYAKALYLSLSDEHTEEGFSEAASAESVIMEFYKFEKFHGIKDLEDYMAENELPDYFIEQLVRLLVR